MAQLENIEAIEKRLWKSADTLRANGNFASNEAFLPIMGLDLPASCLQPISGPETGR